MSVRLLWLGLLHISLSALCKDTLDSSDHRIHFLFICLTSFSLLLSSAGQVADTQAGKSSVQFPFVPCIWMGEKCFWSWRQFRGISFYWVIFTSLRLTWPLDLYGWEKGAVKWQFCAFLRLIGCIFSQSRSVIRLDALILQRYFVTHCLAAHRKFALCVMARCLVCV